MSWAAAVVQAEVTKLDSSGVALAADLMYWNRAIHNTDGVVLATEDHTWLCITRRQGGQCHQLQSAGRHCMALHVEGNKGLSLAQ